MNMNRKWECFMAPFTVAFKHKMDLFIWLLFVILGGQLGTLINLVNRCKFHGWTLQQSLLADSDSGNFYTFSLVLMASILGSLFIRFAHPDARPYRMITIPVTTILIFLVVFNAVCYSFAMQGYAEEFKTVPNVDIMTDFCQLAFFVLSIVFAVINFGVERLDYHSSYKDMDDYLNSENDRVNKIQSKAEEEVMEGDLKV
jgi:hypothetical protein